MPAIIGIYRQALRLSISLAASISGLCIVAAAPIASGVLDDRDQADLVRVLALLILPYTLLGVHSAMLKALARPAWGGFFEAAVWPLLTLGLTALGLLHGGLSPYAIALIYLLDALLAAAGAYAAVRSHLPRGIRAAPMPTRALLGSCVSLTGVELINLATGPVGYLLAMTGHERLLRNVLLATVSLLLPMALLLIPPFGATGAAIAVSTAMIFHNLLCSRLVSKRLGLPFFLAFAR